MTLGTQHNQRRFSKGLRHRPPSLSESDERIGEQHESLDTMECAVSHGEVRACLAFNRRQPHLPQVVHRVADIALSPFDSRNPLHSRIPSALASTFSAFVHPRHTHPSLGVTAALRHAGSHAPFPPPCVLQCLLPVCPSTTSRRSQLVGQNLDVFGTNLCSHGGSL